MTTDWLIAFIGAPAAVVVAGALLVFFTRPIKRPTRRVRGTAAREG